MRIVKEEILKAGGCIAFSEIVPKYYSKEVYQHITEVIKKSKANAIVFFATEQTLSPLMEEIVRQNITGKVWLTNAAWSLSPLFSKRKFMNTLSGTIGIIPKSGNIPGFHDYQYNIHPSTSPKDTWFKLFWEAAFECNWPESHSSQTVNNVLSHENKMCSGKEKLSELDNIFFDVTDFRYTYNVYTAVYAAAHALHNLHACKPEEGPFSNGTCANIREFEPWQLLHYIKKVHFKMNDGRDIFFDRNDSIMCQKCRDDEWSNERHDECIPKLIDYLSYEELMGITFAVISLSSTLFPALILYTFIKYRDTPLVKPNNREISYLLLVGLMLSFLCSLIFIGRPTRVTCMMRQTVFGIIFALCVSCVLAKTIMVVIAFNATKPNSMLKKWVGPKLSISIVVFCTVIQISICIAWLSSAPPFPEKDMKSQIGMIIIGCNEGSTTAFWCVLGYMGLLAIISFIVAFLARNLPDSFNEASFITFSMLIFVSVWLAFIPAYVSTRGKYMVAVEIFAILASSTGLLTCIFFSKCYIILLMSDRNTKEYLLGKGTKSKILSH
ncbi:extracellular calcium-sensing receptor-like [Latimeria chalumnae]|uniref:extracellular calcium-sensing receptor-like n=1 Tax=Latimeria chalumnae TaxID=7897 RepID=UPI00313DB0A5